MYPTEAFSKPEAAQSWQVSAQSVAASHSWAYECTMADADMRRILSKNIFFLVVRFRMSQHATRPQKMEEVYLGHREGQRLNARRLIYHISGSDACSSSPTDSDSRLGD